jgi:hypothetical protein
VVIVVAVAGSIGHALGAAATMPFTWAANVVTGVPIVVITASAIVRWPARPDRSAVLVAEDGPGPRHPYLGWVVLVAAVVAWELAEFLWPGSRNAHPTLSSMADAFDGHYAGKAVAFLAWLWLGAAIVRAGTPVAARFRALQALRS